LISLKRLLERDEGSATREDPLRRVVRLLLESIRLHMPESDPSELTNFRREMQRIEEAFAAAHSVEELMVEAGTALKTMEFYSRQTSKYFSLRNREFEHILAMMAATIRAISAGSEENIRQLRNIQSHVVSVTQLEDVRSIKMQLGECLAQIRTETVRQQNVVAGIVEKAKDALGVRTAAAECASIASPGAPCCAKNLDPVTGLPARLSAEAALEDICQGEGPWHVAVITIDSLQSVNLRFGRDTGNELLCTFGFFIAQLLQPSDHLFRWSGPAFLALLQRSEPFERVREHFGRMLKERRFEHTVVAPSRTILLPLSPRWAVFPPMAAPRQFFERIDAFVASNAH
jgi:GGDEF domain-containing protein